MHRKFVSLHQRGRTLPGAEHVVYDPRDEARRRAEEIYERLVREMRSDLERKLEIAAPPVAWSDFNPQRDAAEAAAVPLR